MKCISLVKRLFFFNLLALLWWPYFCDIRQHDGNPQGIQHHKDSGDLNRITNVPTKQKEIDQINIDIEHTLKENIVQPSVVYVNSELNDESVKDATVDSKSPLGEVEGVQLESSIDEIKKFTLSNVDSSKQTNVHDNMQTITRHVPEKENIPNNPDILLEQSVEGAINLDDTATTAQTVPIPDVEESQRVDQSTLKPKKTSPVVPNVENREMKSDSKEGDAVEPAVVTIFPDSISSAHQHSQYDGMPSFDEWKKMMLAEQEKGGQKVQSPTPPGKKISSQKRRRNYSSYECGAKIVASNSEAEGTNRILNELVDEYMLNPCKAKIWFVIELCETVQTSQIELANFELFSSCPKDFTVYSSDNFPTRDWVALGTYTAAEQRVLQSFELKQEGFGKFIKIELTGHYGKEHYCPLSVVRIFGTSMVDEYEEMETLASQPEVPEDDLDRLDIPIEDQGTTNIFGSATDAVMNIVKKAAQALGQHQPLEEKENNKTSDQLNASGTKLCNLLSGDNKCEDSDSKATNYSTISKIINFTIPLSSTQQSLFRRLHRCDQCVSSRLGYYSSAQPHCRFFQAALGPVMFKALCDWFKEHPLLLSHEVTTNSGRIINSVISDSTLTVTATKSPPPQIIRIPLQDSSYVTMAEGNVSEAIVSNLDTTVTVDITNISRFRLNKTIDADKLKVQPTIEPTKTLKMSDVFGKSKSSDHSVLAKSSQIVQSTEIASDSTIAVPDLRPETVEPSETKPVSEETISVSITTEEQINDGIDQKPKPEEQPNDMLPESVTITPEELASSEAMMGSEFTAGFKIDETQGKAESVTISGMTSASAGQKESVFIRMGNRIKALEINMSLSGQYLQELSQRYRRQMEEMQRTFNRTIGTLNDTAKKAAEKDLKQQEIINSLQSQVENLTKVVELLMSGRSSVFKEMFETHVCLMVTEAIIMITIMSLCVRRISSSARTDVATTSAIIPASPRVAKRRNSADSSSTPPIARKVKKRSCSEEVLVAGENALNAELPPVLTNQKAKKKNRKRQRGLQHSHSQCVMQQQSSCSSHIASKESPANLCTDKSLLIHNKPTHTLNGVSYPCENCNSGSDTNCASVKACDKEKRLCSKPLRNLTNGTIETLSHSLDTRKLQKEKESFSFRKFLKFQKRDSI